MTEWTSEKQRQTAVQAMQILSHVRCGKRQLTNYIQRIREDKDKDLYKGEKDIQETIDLLIQEESFPVRKSNEGSFYERTDIEVTN